MFRNGGYSSGVSAVNRASNASSSAGTGTGGCGANKPTNTEQSNTEQSRLSPLIRKRGERTDRWTYCETDYALQILSFLFIERHAMCFVITKCPQRSAKKQVLQVRSKQHIHIVQTSEINSKRTHTHTHTPHTHTQAAEQWREHTSPLSMPCLRAVIIIRRAKSCRCIVKNASKKM